MDLATAVAPTTLAAERTIPVVEPLRPLLPAGALVRGQVASCHGAAATSLALGLTVEATAAGAWLAVVDVPWVGVEAAAELGVPLERLVRVDPGAGRHQLWADLVTAVLDGFDVVLTRLTAGVGQGTLRRVRARVQARGAVLVVVGAAPTGLSADVTLASSTVAWEGVADGHGHLRARRVAVEAVGRRVPRPRRAELWLPGPGGMLAAAGDDEPVEIGLRSVG